MISFEFLITSMIVVLLPGTGVLYTMSNGLFNGKKASIWAAIGCTFGIVPHLIASTLGLSAIIHQSALAFQVIKYMGVFYLLYLSWNMWNDNGTLDFNSEKPKEKGIMIASKAVLINILNPKLTIFFLSFLPQFVPQNSSNVTASMLLLSIVFMGLTLLVFLIYGVFAFKAKEYLITSNGAIKRIKQSFAGIFALLGLKLAFSD